MNQKIFKKKLLEQKIYEEQKDKSIVSMNHLKNKYVDLKEEVDFKEIYIKIINYQIQTYGWQLADPNQIEYYYLKFLRTNNRDWRRKKWKRQDYGFI